MKRMTFCLSMMTLTLLSGVVLASSTVSADNDSVVDEINITVPSSCTLGGTGMNSHNASINNGQYNSAIGETTMQAFCNDAEGFAIYAIGYTDNTDGNNVLTNSTLGSTYDIVTGTATSGANSNWAMKLSTVTSPAPTYPITIQNGFNNFHNVPDDYTLVAKRESSTDVGANAEGATLKSTYQAYVSSTQPAGTYTGQVKYIMVHPNYVYTEAMRDAVTVVFDGNGLITFPDGSTTNTVKYTKLCKPSGDGYYVGNTYQEVMTSNISSGGVQNGAYSANEIITQPVTVSGADKMLVEVRYGTTAGTIVVIQDELDGNSEPEHYEMIVNDWYQSGTKRVVMDGDTVTIFIDTANSPEEGYDYGAYVKVYPIYNTEQANTTYEQIPSTDCSIVSISGAFKNLPTNMLVWTPDGTHSFNLGEADLLNYLSDNYSTLKGGTLTVYANNPK